MKQCSDERKIRLDGEEVTLEKGRRNKAKCEGKLG
jgi:hypothetical protein